LPRRYRSDAGPIVLLYDTEQERTAQVTERAWTALRAMDGTRDAGGIVIQAAREGARVTEDEIAALVGELAGAGFVVEGSAEDEAARGAGSSRHTEPSDPTAAQRPLEPLPGYALACDGRGSCCRFYPSVVFSPLEAARALVRLPLVDHGLSDEKRTFCPLAGNDARLVAVALVDSRCAYLEADLACGIHRRGGADEKPLGCRTYPARFVDDGASVRVSPWPECACVFRSAAAAPGGGAGLVPPGAASRKDLHHALNVERLPESVLIAPGVSAPHAELADFSRVVATARASDGIAALFGLARSLEDFGLDAERAHGAMESAPPPSAAEIAPWLEALAPRAGRFAAETWRGPRDLVRQTAEGIASALEIARRMPDALLEPSARFAAAEAFYVRVLVFGHQLAHPTGLRPMSILARDRGVRALIARGLAVAAEIGELTDPAFEEPLALVDAAMRAYGLAGYVRDLAVEAAR
jgi:lysine-N-methylase